MCIRDRSAVPQSFSGMGYGSAGDGNGICDSIFSEQPENLLSDESDHGSSVFVCILSVYDGFGSTGEGRYII